MDWRSYCNSYHPRLVLYHIVYRCVRPFSVVIPEESTKVSRWWVGIVDVRIYARRSFVPGILGDNSTGHLGVSPRRCGKFVAISTPPCTGFTSKVEIIVMGVRVASPRILPRHYGLEESLEQLSPEPGVVPYSVQVRSAFLRCDTSRQKLQGGGQSVRREEGGRWQVD
jgi:hypothetical protein